MKQLALIGLAFVVAGWGITGFKAAHFDVLLEDGMPVVKWEAESEEELHHYEIEIHTQFSPQPRVSDVDPHGANKPYVYRDEDLYKLAETVRYELYAVLDSGERLQVGLKHVNYTPTAVRRTWGSIKAMFQ